LPQECGFDGVKIPDENPPVGSILCAENDSAVGHYALGNLANKILASEYKTALPDEKLIAAEVEKTQRLLKSLPKSER